MSSWHVYRKDDPNSWPEIDCPILVYVKEKNEHERLELCEWEVFTKQFIQFNSRRYVINPYFFDECYYQYISYVPNGYTAIKTKKCGLWHEGFCQYR